MMMQLIQPVFHLVDFFLILPWIIWDKIVSLSSYTAINFYSIIHEDEVTKDDTDNDQKKEDKEEEE